MVGLYDAAFNSKDLTRLEAEAQAPPGLRGGGARLPRDRTWLRSDPQSKCYFCCAFDLAQAQSFGQLHLPPLSQEQFIRPHAEHFMTTSLIVIRRAIPVPKAVRVTPQTRRKSAHRFRERLSRSGAGARRRRSIEPAPRNFRSLEV
jgi:hypothetical protein